MKADHLYTTYKYTLYMAPIRIQFKELLQKLLKHRDDFIHRKLEFFLSPVFWDNNSVYYYQHTFDIDSSWDDAQKFLSKIDYPKLKYFHVEITSERGVHIISHCLFPFGTKREDFARVREVIKDIFKNSPVDFKGSINPNPFRRFPGLGNFKRYNFLCIPIPAKDFITMSRTEIWKTILDFKLNQFNFIKYVKKYILNLKVYQYDILFNVDKYL